MKAARSVPNWWIFSASAINSGADHSRSLCSDPSNFKAPLADIDIGFMVPDRRPFRQTQWAMEFRTSKADFVRFIR